VSGAGALDSSRMGSPWQRSWRPSPALPSKRVASATSNEMAHWGTRNVPMHGRTGDSHVIRYVCRIL
jgi:hypothetical protein